MSTPSIGELSVCKRDGREVTFDPQRIEVALRKAFRAERSADRPTAEETLPTEIENDIQAIVQSVVEAAAEANRETTIGVEQVQDIVEIGLMKRQHYRVSRRYILYRSEQARVRAVRQQDSDLLDRPGNGNEAAATSNIPFYVTLEPGVRVPFDATRLERFLTSIPAASASEVSTSDIIDEVIRSGFDGMTTDDLARSLVLSTRCRIERDPAFDRLAAALQLSILYRQALGVTQTAADFERVYRDRFEHFLIEGIREGRLSEQLREFDLAKLTAALQPLRDTQFRYLGVQTIYDRYLLHVDGRRIETPQYFWMRVSMGLALAESADSRTDRAIEFYRLLSSFRFTSATPTLFNSGTCHPQLSSCYLTTVQDDLEDIFACISDNAMLSKWAGGLGNDWTNVRATGSLIKGTNGTSQGVIPFLKVVNDAAVAVNQGGKRKGAVCAYMEPWHLDFEEFLDLRKNTGDDRRRTHDMHTASWIPDLFMQRLRDGGTWTLFSPQEVPDLHDTYGKAFQERYEHYERQAEAGKIKQHRQVPAVDLWRKLLTRTFETGHPWVTFKDPSNIRSPQDHVGVVHSSNLCTEILLNTSQDETAVCNLGSINLAEHIVDGKLDHQRLCETVTTAMRMLDNVIDINFYPTPKSKNANTRHRPVGLGMMGFQDALQRLGISYASEAAIQFADESAEAISYYAILASSNLAKERGTYQTYNGSKWDRGLLPIDTLELLQQERGETLDVDRGSTLDWQPVREAIAEHGMRNSNCLAIAPTATISTIIGVTQSIEPTYKYLYAKSNLSGDFIQVHADLVEELKRRELWNAGLLDELKYHDGTLAEMPSIPQDIKELFCSAFEIDPRWLIEAAARRQKWIDQGQSLNLYVAQPSGKAIDAMYQHAWKQGLKTTYYLRSLAATQVEKSTVDVNRHGIQPRWMKSASSSSSIRVDRASATSGSVCSIDDPDCEACQ
ncbi:ribonucleoside-diphosphate reductase subunit alpha [Rhodopirellula sp. MGV]|uniref:ribonucleoside-diphosphate reductase subunit alpha n=1 Tax=Rhodopirellula sp. MGV TaxID=2023130 RepID=UPI000B962B4F|nr:ribonucleoside-diphosphate reductase subunit alpha [Rhodopirellula sp. MGV]OYP34225.1 ribonucleoside-diphosphate reductase subunit alpha [Rhodopirellula sp. MGV]PNY35031.1 ribonucleoside-diphosphate reductase subunit alpha [Rhodopirellula baltica]